MNVLDQQMKLAHAFLNKVSEQELYVDHFLGPNGAKTLKSEDFGNNWLYRTLQRVAAEDPFKHRMDYLQDWTTPSPTYEVLDIHPVANEHDLLLVANVKLTATPDRLIDPPCSLRSIGARPGHGASVYFTKPIRKE